MGSRGILPRDFGWEAGHTHVVEAEEDAPEGKEHAGHHEHVRHVAKGGPVHFRVAAATPAGSLPHDEVGGEESDEGDESDDWKGQRLTEGESGRGKENLA